MSILHRGHSEIQSSSRSLQLHNILHAPKTTKNLLSVHKLTTDKDVFVEFHPHHFVVKDRATKMPLLHGRCRGLYPTMSTFRLPQSSKETLSSIKVSKEGWHYRLGHPSPAVIQHVLQQNKLPFSSQHDNNSLCNACQQAKSRQLPFPISNSTSSAPLELIFSNVWGPARASVNGFKYYVSFIDDFSKHTWIYLLKSRVGVFTIFLHFQKHVERTLNRKILCVQSNWGGEY